MQQKWFRQRRYKLGWYPITWQGWFATGAFALLIIALASQLGHGLVDILLLAIIATLFVMLCITSSEKPR